MGALSTHLRPALGLAFAAGRTGAMMVFGQVDLDVPGWYAPLLQALRSLAYAGVCAVALFGLGRGALGLSAGLGMAVLFTALGYPLVHLAVLALAIGIGMGGRPRLAELPWLALAFALPLVGHAAPATLVAGLWASLLLVTATGRWQWLTAAALCGYVEALQVTYVLPPGSLGHAGGLLAGAALPIVLLPAIVRREVLPRTLLWDHLGEAVYILDPDGYVRHKNRAASGQNLYTLVPQVRDIVTLLEPGEVRRLSQPRTDWTFYRLEGGEVVVIGRAPGEQAMRAREQLQAAFDAIPDPLLLIDRDYNVVRANNAAGGLQLQESRPRCYELLFGRESPCPDCRLQAVFAGGGSLRWEMAREESVYDVHNFPVPGESGPVPFAIEYLRDVTREKALQGDNLRQARLAAVGELAAGVAHNYNNVLAGVRVQLELLQLLVGGEHPMVDRALTDATAAVEKGADMTRKLIAFARGEQPRLQAVRLEEAVAEALDLARVVQGRPGINHVVQLDAALPQVLADPSWLQQVLVNLVINAYQAMPQGGTLTVRGYAGKGGSRVCLEVADTGIGIEPQNLDRLFQPFFSTKTGHGRGTGLGLSTSLGMMQAMDGDIKVQSRPGAGTCFYVFLQRAPGEAAHG